MPLVVVNPPASLPLTLTQIKQHLRIDHADDDAYFLELADAATAHAEALTNHALIERTVRQFDGADGYTKSLVLKGTPVVDVLSVTGFLADGSTVVLAPSLFQLSKGNEPRELQFLSGSNISQFINGLEIDYRIGFANAGDSLPSNIKRALLALVAHWYEHRGTQTAGFETALVPDGLNTLLAPFMKRRIL